MNLPSKSRSSQSQRLVDLNHVTRWKHIPDAARTADLKLANLSCNHCYGTGVAGQLVVTHGKPAEQETRLDPLYERVQLTCACVVRREVERAEAVKKAQKTAAATLSEEEVIALELGGFLKAANEDEIKRVAKIREAGLVAETEEGGTRC